MGGAACWAAGECSSSSRRKELRVEMVAHEDTPSGFNYGRLDAATRATMETCHDEIRRREKRAAGTSEHRGEPRSVCSAHRTERGDQDPQERTGRQMARA